FHQELVAAVADGEFPEAALRLLEQLFSLRPPVQPRSVEMQPIQEKERLRPHDLRLLERRRFVERVEGPVLLHDLLGLALEIADVAIINVLERRGDGLVGAAQRLTIAAPGVAGAVAQGDERQRELAESLDGALLRRGVETSATLLRRDLVADLARART